MKTSCMVPLTLVVLTYDEQRNLPTCLESVAGWIKDLIVLDSGSTDMTKEIAMGYDATIVDHPFETHAKQWEWALGNLPVSTEWVLCLDADQRVTPDLRDEIIRLFTEEEDSLTDLDGFYVKRRQVFRGRWIRHGGYYPKYMLKLFRKDAARTDKQDLMDHHFYITGRAAKLRNDIIEDNHKERDITFWIEKHNRYARLLAEEEFRRVHGGVAWPIHPTLFGTPDQQAAWLKRLWYRLPLYSRPLVYFVYRYFLRLGLLDGKQGFIFHFLQAFWFRLLVDIHLDQLRGDKIQDPGRRS